MTDIEKEALYRDYSGKVLGYMRSRINSSAEAEDLTSTVFLKIFEKLDTFEPEKASLSTWIYTVARNTLTDYFRTRRVFEEVPETLQDGSSVEEETVNHEQLDSLAGALKKLPERERDIIVLRYWSGKTLKEIAAGLGISYAYVKVLQNNALAALRKEIGDFV